MAGLPFFFYPVCCNTLALTQTHYLIFMKTLLLLVSMTCFSFSPYGDGKCHKSDGRCSGTKYCSACKNCKYCKHCNSGGVCGVCSPESFVEKKAVPAKKKTLNKKVNSKTK